MAERSAAPEPPLLPSVALGTLLVAGAFGLVMPAVLLLHRPSPLPAPFPGTENQTGESLVYVLTFGLLLPAGLWAGTRLARGIARGPNAAGLGTLVAVLGAALALGLCGVRLAGLLGRPDGVKTVAVAALVWWGLAAGLLARTLRGGAWPALLRGARRGSAVAALASGLLLVALLALTDTGSVSLVGLAAGLALAAGAALLARRGVAAPGRRGGRALDGLVLAAVLLLVPDLVILRPELVPLDPRVAYETGVAQFHQDFLLAPAAAVLHGGAMLVDVASQYGVGSILWLVGWFHVAPIGYGTLGLLDGLMTAAWFAAGFGVLRMAGVPRSVAAATLGTAIVALSWNLRFPVGSLPQDGPLRLGLPMAVIVPLVAATRWPARARLGEAAACLGVGLASIWSLEAFAASAAIFAVLVVCRAWPASGRPALRDLARPGAGALAACVAAHVLFALATLAAAGHLPDWGQYLAFLRAFLTGNLGDFTFDVPRWSPGLAVGAAYVASWAGLAELARRRTLGAAGAPAFVALGGLTAYGTVLLYYFVDRSQGHVLIHVALPALLLGGLWAGLVARHAAGAARSAGLAFAAAVACLLVAVAWSSIGDRVGRTPLARLLPGGASVHASVDRLVHLPALNVAAPDGVRLLRRAMPGEERSLVVTTPDLGVEILLRSGRDDRLALGDPLQTSFVVADALGPLRERLAGLRPGTRMLLDRRGARQLATFRARPGLRPLRQESNGAVVLGRGGITAPGIVPELALLQQYALQRIAARFGTRTVARGRYGLRVVELTRRAST